MAKPLNRQGKGLGQGKGRDCEIPELKAAWQMGQVAGS